MKKSKKAIIGELAEEVEATGQESETRAAKWVIEKGKEDQKRQQAGKANTLELLEEKNKFKIIDYWRTVADVMTIFTEREEFPLDWDWRVVITDRGVVMRLLSPDKRAFVRAFTPSHIPNYDLVAISKVLESAWVCVKDWQKEHSGEQVQTSFN